MENILSSNDAAEAWWQRVNRQEKKKMCTCIFLFVHCGPALLGESVYGLCSHWCETRNTHSHARKKKHNNRWKTCSPGGFVTASTRAAHCYGAISLMGLVSVRQRAKIIIFQGLNFIPWQQFRCQEGTVATAYYHDVWVEADAAGDVVDFNANQTPIRARLSSS